MKIPSIKSSAQARLLLYKILSSHLSQVETKLILAEPFLYKQITALLEQEILDESKNYTSQLEKIFSHIEKATKEGLQKQVAHLSGQNLWLGVNANFLLDSFVDEHTKLIKSVRLEHLDKISLIITRGLRDGLLSKDIAKEIKEATNLSKRRSKLIAHNAPLQYSGALTKHYQITAGIKKYMWQTSGDERVRESHQKLNGKIFNWSDKGPYPRSEIRCRCDAVPVVG
jgi:SPP1 gp7 family putative phage head morphogenesis protein